MAVGDACHSLPAIKTRPPVSRSRFALMAAAGASAPGVVFDAADAVTLHVIALLPRTGACLGRGLSSPSGNLFLQPLAADLLARAGGGGPRYSASKSPIVSSRRAPA